MNAKPYPKYKASGVEWLGDVPEHWEVKRLDFLARVKARLGWKGLTADEYVPEGFIFLSTPNIKGQGDIDFINVNYINEERYIESPEIMVQVGDVLLAKDGSTLGTTNLVRHLPAPTTVNSSIAILRPKPQLNGGYFFRWMTGAYLQAVIQSMKDGQGVPHLFQADIKKFPIFLPPPTEQQAISDFLDDRTAKLDALLEKKRAVIGKLKEKRCALISTAVTKGLPTEAAAQAGLPLNPKLKPSGIPWLGDIPKHWEVWKHSHLFNSSMGQTILKEEVSDSGILPVLSATETYAVFGYLDTAAVILNKGDFVIPARGNSIGHVKLVRERCTTTQTTIYSKKLGQKIHSEYAYYYLMGNRDTLFHFDRTAIPQLTVGQVQSNPFLLPPLSEQVAIATYLDREAEKIDRMIQKVESAIEKLTEYRAALITAAVTGKIDVRHR